MKRYLFVLLLLFTACSGASNPSADSPNLDFGEPPPAIEDVQCESLLEPREITGLLGKTPDLVVKDKLSCHWPIGRDSFQLVMQTGEVVSTWSALILEDYTERLGDSNPPVWKEPGEDSYAIFADDRGMLVHGIRDRDVAVDLLRLAFSRLR